MALCADLFQREELADVDLVLRAPAEHEPAGAAAASGSDRPPASKRPRLEAAVVELARFPAHRVVLRHSEYFKAQMQRWAEPTDSSSGRPVLTLTLERPQQQAAATTVLAAMYGVRGALAQLEQAQLVDAVLLADMLQAPDVVGQAVDGLKAAAASEAGLSPLALAALRSLAAWPSCLRPLLPHLPLPLATHGWISLEQPGDGDLAAVLAAPGANAMQRVLLAALGDLERAWADEQLTAQLLALPLPAMQLLLASDELQVATEDTVLYTAERYVREQPEAARDAARSRLAVLVRAPQLSGFALSAAALAADAGARLLGPHLPQLRQLASMARLEPSSEHIQEALPRAPSAWHLGPRRIKSAADGVQAVWRLPVAELAAACRRCAEERKAVDLFSPVRTPPLGALAWQLRVQCCWQEGDSGCEVGLYCQAVDPLDCIYYKHKFTLSCGDVSWQGTPTHPIKATCGWGWRGFFCVGAMRGGWDAAAWAAKGWPAEGEHLELRLTVHEVF